MLAMLGLSTAAMAQRSVTHQSLLWYGYTVALKFNSLWYWHTEVQERHFVDPFAQHQMLVRSHLHRRLGQRGWEVSAGLCYFLQSPNDPKALVRLAVPELRPHVELAMRHTVGWLTLDHRFRTEARFYHGTDAALSVLEDGFAFSNYRLRYRLQLSVPILQWDEQRALRAKLGDEIHLNAGQRIPVNIFEQNRVSAGLSIDVLPNLSVDVGYLNWYQLRSTGAYYNRNILSFTVLHEVDLARRKTP